MDRPGTWSDMRPAIILPDPVHEKSEMCFCVLLRVYGLVFITMLMYNPFGKLIWIFMLHAKGG
jgi:hypothetical protein